MNTTPDTTIFMIAGYAVFFLVMAVYLVSLFLRWNRLQRDLQTLEELERERQRRVPPPARTAARKPAARRQPKQKR